jgi:SP family general alpha glucoside:H+ symporter-like MFS transporter
MQNGKLIIPASTQGALGNIATCGQLVGLVVTGFCQERYGAKLTFFWGMIFMIGTIFLAVFAQSMAMLMGAEFIMGIPWGMFQTLTTAYASGERAIPRSSESGGWVADMPAEICPINMRGYLAAYASVGWGGGRFVSTGVLRGTLGMKGDWAWRLPYAIQWIWPVPLAALVMFAPESESHSPLPDVATARRLRLTRQARGGWYARAAWRRPRLLSAALPDPTFTPQARSTVMPST